MKVSILTTTARRGFVEKQAEMIASQKTGYELEWVLVDFAYEERQQQVANLISKNLSITHVPNVRDDKKYFRDISRNRNKALQMATGNYVIFLDDYAVIPPDFVENHMKILKECALSCGQMYRLECPTTQEILDNIPRDIVECSGRYPSHIGKDYRNKNGQPYKSIGISYTGNLGIPRELFETLNGFDPRMESALEDCDFGIRAHMAGFQSYFNPDAYTINLNTGGFPYFFSFDHSHDCEPFICNANNKYWGNAKLPENEFMTVEFFEHYRIAHCKKCGAQGMIDPNELVAFKMQANEISIPTGLSGGLDNLRRRENG